MSGRQRRDDRRLKLSLRQPGRNDRQVLFDALHQFRRLDLGVARRPLGASTVFTRAGIVVQGDHGVQAGKLLNAAEPAVSLPCSLDQIRAHQQSSSGWYELTDKPEKNLYHTLHLMKARRRGVNALKILR